MTTENSLLSRITINPNADLFSVTELPTNPSLGRC